jgi:hypothetical protein
VTAALLHQERLARIMRAVALEEPDRTPVVLEYAGFAARATSTPLPEFLASLGRSVEVMIEAFHMVEGADAVNYGAYSPYALSYLWMSKVKVPGVDLPAGESVQVVESELMRAEDYDTILRDGWPAFYCRFMEERVLGGVPPHRLPPAQPPVDVLGTWAAQGIPVFSGGDVSPPFELLCGARSMAGFFTDLLAIPDKVEEVMDAVMPHLCRPVCEKAAARGYPAVWVGGWRSAGRMLSRPLWERFVWPYLERAVNEVAAMGLIALLHLDSDWTRDLDMLRTLPAGRCILSTDGGTDLRKAKEILGGRMCLMGDVPAALLAFGTPDQVYQYSRKRIEELGPRGFILHSGCDIPDNAQVANVRAMVAAAIGG